METTESSDDLEPPYYVVVGTDPPNVPPVTPARYSTREYADQSEDYIDQSAYTPPGCESVSPPDLTQVRDGVEAILACIRPNIRAMEPRVYECGDGTGT